MRRKIFTPEHDMFRATARAFFEKECAPHADEWEKNGVAERGLAQGGRSGPARLGGARGVRRQRGPRLPLQRDPRRGGVATGARGHRFRGEQRHRPAVPARPGHRRAEAALAARHGRRRGHHAIAMSEPGAGSDLKRLRTAARRDGDDFVVNGAKTFISNGAAAHLVIVAAKTDPAAGHKGISPARRRGRDMPGFTRRPEAGQDRSRAADTVRTVLRRRAGARGEPAGRAGQGLLPRSCTTCRRSGWASPSTASPAPAGVSTLTLEYAKTREAFGSRSAPSRPTASRSPR